MVEVLLALVLLLTALTLFNLLLVLGVVRRLRGFESRLGQLAAGPGGVMRAEPGSLIPSVTARSVVGRELSLPSGEPTLIGFFSPGCDACHERVPAFQEAVAAHAGSVVAVVVRDGGSEDELVSQLTGPAGGAVVVEESGGPLTGAFGVQGFPAFAYLDGAGVLVSHSFELPLPQPA